MRKLILALCGATALSLAPAAHADVTFNFNNPSGDLGDDHDYTSGSLTVTASGYSDTDVDEHLWGKNGGGDENGLGLVGDPTGDHEIYFPESFIQLDVSDLFGTDVDGVSFFMNSTTEGESWAVWGNNVDAAGMVSGVLLLSGSDEGVWRDLPDFGQYSFYNFFSTSDAPAGNVLLGGITLSEMPEPGTWATMLLGFGAVGYAMRRRRKLLPQLA